jgi:hypothetical protein
MCKVTPLDLEVENRATQLSHAGKTLFFKTTVAMTQKFFNTNKYVILESKPLKTGLAVRAH